MKKKENKIFVKILFLLFLLIFSFGIFSSVFAQALVPCGLGDSADCTLCHLVIGFKNIYEYLLEVLFAATMLVVVIAGIMYLVSSGNKTMMDKAKSALTYAITAVVIALLAWLVINAILNAFGFRHPLGGKWYEFTCDTSQSLPQQTTNSGTATLPGASGSQTGKGGGISGKGSDIQVPQDGSKLAATLEKYKGTIYEWGKNYVDSNGVLHTDCSGFVYNVYKEAFGIELPRHSSDQGNQPFNYSQLTNGTILESNGHVGIYYNGSVYHNSGKGRDVKVVELGKYLRSHKVTEMRLPLTV